jgi:hypothetical protein
LVINFKIIDLSSEQQKELIKNIESTLDKLLSQLTTKSNSKELQQVNVIQWNFKIGILSRIGIKGNSSSYSTLTTLISLLSGSIFYLRKSKKVNFNTKSYYL